MSRILCVDDEPQLLRTLAANLRARRYEVNVATTGEQALQVAAESRPDVVILDLGLPGISGLEVIRRLRHWSEVPIVVLSARQGESDKIAALDAGADDFVSKPFGIGELLARVRAALRRAVPLEEEPVITTADFAIDLAGRRVTTPSGEARLTPIEWGIVEALVRNRGRLVTSRELLHQVWGAQYDTETNYLRVHLAHVRRKLEPEPGRPRYFHTETGVGYRFQPPGDG